MRTTSRILATLAVAGLATSLSSCTPAPGQYRIYKVTSLPANPQADCGVEIDIRDSTTFFAAGTIAIFATDTDDFFIEYGDKVLTGSRDGKDYTFEGVSVQVDDPIDGTTITTTSQWVVNVTIEGRKINGTLTTFDSSVCGGTCDAFENTACTVVGDFFGAEIKDVELEHPI
jgi:hypothetical protein